MISKVNVEISEIQPKQALAEAGKPRRQELAFELFEIPTFE